MVAQIRFVLIGTTHPGNIGAVARAMKCMMLTELDLVAPRFFPHPDAVSRAAGADDILSRARVFEKTSEAIGDCVFVVGTTARERAIEWPVDHPREAAEEIMAQAEKGPVALLFGRESRGLTNEEVDMCHLLVRIPTGPEYGSLNIASAAQVLAYELYLQQTARNSNASAPVESASVEDMARLYQHLETTLQDLDFIKTTHPTKLMRKLIRLFNRAQPTLEEVNILRGILTAAQAAARGRQSNSG